MNYKFECKLKDITLLPIASIMQLAYSVPLANHTRYAGLIPENRAQLKAERGLIN